MTRSLEERIAAAEKQASQLVRACLRAHATSSAWRPGPVMPESLLILDGHAALQARDKENLAEKFAKADVERTQMREAAQKLEAENARLNAAVREAYMHTAATSARLEARTCRPATISALIRSLAGSRGPG